MTFRQTGGFAGLSRGCELDTEAMSAKEALKLERLVARSRLGGPLRRGSEAARDLTSYRITVETAQGPSTVEYDDETMPEEATELLAYLQACAKPAPLG